ncbi:hypothetical protein HIM_06713 [Hirsutella minnesotensis 3608]|uniref:Uncharacterized protein n=1 Tax=Hirsutella minnesotensis 3608 TaxID=1043627 RepID=A0A0F7ZNI7_9HYPO|nr:hypothetical protein HIM_06713 [Hirsutella minnesotensis 3608]
MAVPDATRLLDLLSLKGKVVAITGVSGFDGIGHEVARGCAEMGADVAMTYYQRQDEARRIADDIQTEYGVRVKAYALDVTDEEATRQFVDDVVRDFGRIDSFVANAGIVRYGPFNELPVTEWEQVFKVNLVGTMHCARAVRPYFQKQGYGSLVISASTLGHYICPFVPGTAYVSSKAGLLHLGRQLAYEWRAFARVNTVFPGYLEVGQVPTIGEVFAAGAEKLAAADRLGKAKEIKAAYVYLMSDASSFTTGSDISCDGGLRLGPSAIPGQTM